MRPASLARLAYGRWLCVDPRGLVGGVPADRRLRIVVRILGLRHFLQAVAVTVWPAALVRRLGAGMDGLHAASDAGFAVADRRCLRPAVIDGTIAVAFLTDALMPGGWR